MKKNIMLDLETLGTTADSVIVSIGAVYFDETGLGEEFYEKINIQSSLDLGRKVTAGTLLFWLRQEKEAQDSTFDVIEHAEHLHTVLRMFSKFANMGDNGKPSDVCVWGMVSDFDCAMLADAYTSCQIQQPWRYSSARCFRTLRALYPKVLPPDRVGTYHNALDDAKTQALHAVAILQQMDEDREAIWKYKELSK